MRVREAYRSVTHRVCHKHYSGALALPATAPPLGPVEDARGDACEFCETCDRCDAVISADEISLGWPVAVHSHDSDWPDYICPSCYGDEAYCSEGHVLPVGSDCPRCEEVQS